MRMETYGRVVATLAFATLGIALTSQGCGPNGARYFCDQTGCYECDGYGCTQVKPPTKQNCTGDAQCPSGQICTSNGCTAQCKIDGDCPKGTICKNGLCAAPTEDPGTQKQCTTTADCKGGYCKNNQCIACGDGKSGPCPCTPQGKECAQNEVCSAGFCTSNPICKYSSECGDGKVCADGQCLTDCGSGQACANGFVCQQGLCKQDPNAGKTCAKNADCAMTEVCVGGKCATSCTGTGQGTCAQGLVCNQGACVPNLGPIGECGNGGTTMCNANQQCIGGYCKYTCSSDQECKLIDTRIGYCGKDMVCRTATEAHPECTLSSECTGGKLCVANACK